MPGFQFFAVGVAAFPRADMTRKRGVAADDGALRTAFTAMSAVYDTGQRVSRADVAQLERLVNQMALARRLIVQDEWDEDGCWGWLVEDHLRCWRVTASSDPIAGSGPLGERPTLGVLMPSAIG